MTRNSRWWVGMIAAASLVCSMRLDAEDAPSKPQPAEIMPDAERSLMLDVTAAGDHLVAVGSRGQIMLSDDGSTWTQVETPVRATLTAVNFVDAEHGWAVGHDATVVHTIDGGKTWTLQAFDPDLKKPLLDVTFLDQNNGFAVGAFGLFERTSDGGTHWSRLDPAADAREILADTLHLFRLAKLDNGFLLIAGEQGLLGLSKDGGRTWTRLQSPYEGSFFGAVPVGSAGVLLCGLRGNVFTAVDINAPDWKKVETKTSDSLFGCADLGEGRVGLAGLNGTLLTVNTASGDVTRVPSEVDSALSAVATWKAGLVTVGESGIHRVPAPK